MQLVSTPADSKPAEAVALCTVKVTPLWSLLLMLQEACYLNLQLDWWGLISSLLLGAEQDDVAMY